MKFGIFYEMQMPRPWKPDGELKLYQNALDQIEMADQLGYDHAWVVEHHFLEEYSHSPAPEVFLGAATQRTKRIRLGNGIVQLPTNHPARAAERVAALDLLSNGRMEFGVGEGSTIIELDPFNVPIDKKREIFEDAVRAVMPMFGDDRWEYHGEYYDFPSRNVLPKPYQKPHPPLWLACSNVTTIEYAGQRGFGALGFQFVSADAAHSWVSAYYNGIVNNLDRLADYAINPNIALVSHFMCAETDEEARLRAEGCTFFQWCLRYYGAYRSSDSKQQGEANLWAEYTKWKADNAEAVEASTQSGLIGSPETIRRKLRKFESSNIDQVILLNQTGNAPHDHICESLDLFAKEVMPEFHANIPAHEEWKSAVLAGDIKLGGEQETKPAVAAQS